MKLTTGRLPAPRDLDRRDPGYDGPGPLTTADFRDVLILFPIAIVFVVGMLVGMGFFIVAFTPR